MSAQWQSSQKINAIIRRRAQAAYLKAAVVNFLVWIPHWSIVFQASADTHTALTCPVYSYVIMGWD